MNSIEEALIKLKEDIYASEEIVRNQTKELDSRGIKWFQYDNIKEKMVKEGADKKLVKINVGGKIFSPTLLTILNNPDCLFFNLLMTEHWNYTNELFLDRGYKYFPVILSWMRNGAVTLDDYKDEQIYDILAEARFYCLKPMINFLENYTAKIFLVSFEFSGEYRSGDQVAGTNNIEDLNDHDDTSCMKGVCTGYTGWIIFELNREVDVENIEIGGWRGNTNLYASSNGSGASILTSLNKVDWTQVGTINSSYGNGPMIHTVTPSRAKYIKLNHNSYLGIGYFRVVK